MANKAHLNRVLGELLYEHSMGDIVKELGELAQYHTEQFDREAGYRPTAAVLKMAETWRSWAHYLSEARRLMTGHPGTRPLV